MRSNEFYVGQQYEYTVECTEQKIDDFAHAIQDFNPIHLDNDVARTYGLRGRIAHGMWTAGLISSALATEFPGPGTIYLGQTLNFVAPVYPGDSLKLQLEINAVEKKKLRISCEIKNYAEETVLSGEALVLYRPIA